MWPINDVLLQVIRWELGDLKKEKQRQQGYIPILYHISVLKRHESTELKKGTHKNKELVVSMLLTLPDVLRHFKGTKMHKSNVNHEK